MKYDLIYGKSAFCLPGSAVDYAAKASQNDLRVLMALGSGRFADEKSIASFLGISASAVSGSLEFWRGTGVMESSAENGAVPEQSVLSASSEAAKKVKAPEAGRDDYTSAEIDRICAQTPTTKELVDMCQTILEKTFTKTEISSIIYLSDHLRLEDEYILMLCTHCKSKDKASLKYVQKLGIELHDKGIDSVKSLDIYIKNESKKHEMEYKIRKLFGMGDRALVPKENMLLDKWITEWNLPFEIIEKAYEVMINATQKPNMSYENAILEKWRAEGCKTIADVEALLGAQKKAPKKQGSSETSFDLDEFFDLAVKRGAGSPGADSDK